MRVKVAAGAEPQISQTPQNPSSRKQHKSAKSECKGCDEKSLQEVYIPLIDLPEAQQSELVFNSRSPQAMDVTPIFYKLDGTVIIAAPVRVKSAEIRYVDLKTLLPEQYRYERDWGGLSLTYTGVNREMWAQFRLLDVNGGDNVDEFFTVKNEKRSDVQEAVWWLPRAGLAIIALGNITDVQTGAEVYFSDGQTQSVSLAPHATEIIRHRNNNEKDMVESVKIEITGAAGSVIPTGAVETPNGSYNSVIRFYDPKNTVQPNLYGNDLHLAGTEPHLVLRNTSAQSVTATPKFIPLAGAASDPVILPAISLNPFEITEVDLKALKRAIRKRNDLDTVSVQIQNSYKTVARRVASSVSLCRRCGAWYEL